MTICKTPVKLSLNWVRSVVYEHGRIHDSDPILELYNSLISKPPYYVSVRKGKISTNVKIDYGDRTAQRRRTYEIMELIRDKLEHRIFEDGTSIYRF